MNILILLALLSAAAGLPNPAPQTPRILIGVPPVPVVSGEVWLIANRWGAYPGLLVATIDNGELHVRNGVEFPQYWDQAFDYKVLVAVSSHPTPPPSSLSEDYAYGVGDQPPAYLHPYPDIYLSPPLAKEGLGKNWQRGLEALGQTSGDALVLPPPARHTLRLEYPDGKPFAGAHVNPMLYGSSENHCGVPVGIFLGSFTTDSKGEIHFTATSSALALYNGYFQQTAGGLAGTMFTYQTYVIVGAREDITVKRLWKLPEYDYVLSLNAPDNHTIAHARLTACDNFEGCGAGCGPVQGPASDEHGVLRFRHQDLRAERSLTLVNASGQTRDLSTQEMSQLLTSHRLDLVW